MQAQVRCHRVDIGAATRLLANLVHYRVFRFQRDELRMRQLRGRGLGVNGKGSAGREHSGPVHRLHPVVEFFRRCSGNARQYQQHTAGNTRLQTEAIGRLKRGHTAPTVSTLLDRLGARFAQLCKQQVTEATGSGNHQFVARRFSHRGFTVCLGRARTSRR